MSRRQIQRKKQIDFLNQMLKLASIFAKQPSLTPISDLIMRAFAKVTTRPQEIIMALNQLEVI